MQTLYLTIFEYNLNEQKQDEMTKLQTPNTSASCGRNDAVRKQMNFFSIRYPKI